MHEGRKSRKRSILLSVVLIISMVVLTTSSVFTFLLVEYRTTDLLKLVDSRLLTAAEMSRELLGTDYHDRIADERSVSQEQFHQIVQRNDALCRRLNLQYLWSVLLTGDRVVFTSATHSDLKDPNSPCAAFFETHRDPASFAPVMQPGATTTFSSFKNEWGEGRMVLIPGKDSQGRTYVFGASVQLNELNALNRKTILTSSGIGLAVITCAFLLTFLLARSFTAPIARLTASADRMAAGDFETPLGNAGTRELESLALSLDMMRQGLKEQLTEVRDSEERLRLALAGADLGTWDWHVPSGAVRLNERWAEMLGYALHEIKPHLNSWKALIHPDDSAYVMSALNAHLAGKRPEYETEHRLRHKSGEWIWVLDKGCIIERDVHGKPIRACGTHLDISGRKRAEAEIRESVSRYRAFFDNGPDGVVILDPESARILEFNDRACHQLGYSREEFTSLRVFDIEAAETREETRARIQKVIRDKRGDFETRHRTKHGEMRDVHVMAQVIETGGHATYHCVWRDITERKQAATALQASEERYRRIVETANEGIWAMDRQHRTTFVNAHMAQMLGRDAAEIIGRCVEDFMFPEDLKGHQERMLQRHDAQAGSYMHRFRRPDNSEVWTWVSATAVKDAMGNFDGSFAMFTDITERKRAAEALRESEEAHRALVAGLPDIVTRFDRDARLLFVSDNVSALLGIPKPQCLGKTHRDLGFPEAQCLFWEEALRQVLQSGTPLETELAVAGEAGTAIYNCRFIPERDAQGAIRSVLSLSRDITAHRKAEQDYRILFREMLEGFAVHEILCDEQGTPINYRFLAVNPAFERMTGLKAEDLLGKTVLEVLSATEQRWIETYGKVALTGDPVYFEDYSVELKKHFEVTAFRPAPRHFACIFSDITERKRAEEERERLQAQLMQSQKMESVGRLAGGVAHDFNNMLQVILNHVAMALEDVDPAQPLRESLEEIQKAAQRSAALTRQLLAFARQQTVAPKVLDLNETIEGTLKLIRRLIGEDIDLAWMPGSGLWPVKVDPVQLDQVLANLCVNARDAIAGVGRISIETKNCSMDESRCLDQPDCVPGDYVQITVSDNGCGMDSETLLHLFEPFFTTKDVGKGTGLGLATVYGIVKQNDGMLRVNSAPGQGASVEVFLPRHRGASEQAPAGGSTKAHKKGHETILLVEDELLILRSIKTILEKLGYQVLAASTPGEAIRTAEEHAGEVGLLMTDVVMPEMNGRDLARRLLARHPRLKRLFMSGYTADIIAHHGVLDEGVSFIQKPFTMQSLAAKVRDVLDNS